MSGTRLETFLVTQTRHYRAQKQRLQAPRAEKRKYTVFAMQIRAAGGALGQGKVKKLRNWGASITDELAIALGVVI